MARSSAETEYQAMTSTTSELTWIKQIVADMSITIPKPMKIFCDNQVARHITLNLMFHERTKYIDVDCHFVREKIQVGEIKTPFEEVKTNQWIFLQKDWRQDHLKRIQAN
jgi:hypothetical protein